jgi:hypothetical protein
VSTRRKRRRVADDARDRKYGCEDTFHDHVPSLIDFAHPFDVVAEAENESASSTKRERVHEASAFDRNGNTSTAFSNSNSRRAENCGRRKRHPGPNAWLPPRDRRPTWTWRSSSAWDLTGARPLAAVAGKKD